MIRKAGLFLLFMPLFIACTRVSDDATPPEIVGFSIDQGSFEPGESLLVSIAVSDDEELNQLRVKVEQAFSKSFGFWEFVDVRDLAGSSYTSQYTYFIPDSALAGLYEISLQVADERGNGSVDSTLQFQIRQPSEEPVISGFETDPAIDMDEVLRLSSNDTLTFSGTLSDTDSLQSFSISFRDPSGLVLRSVEYAVMDCTIYELQAFPDTVFLESFEISPTEMLLKLQDKPGHQNRVTYSVEVD